MANNFANDPNCRALWRMENGALTEDAIGGNTLTAQGSPTADTGDYREGAASGEFASADTDGFVVADADADAGMPFRAADPSPVMNMSVAFWCQVTVITASATLFAKTASADASFWIRLSSAGGIEFYIYTNSSWQLAHFVPGMTVGQWYHIVCTYDNSDKSYRVSVWDADAAAPLAADLTGSFTGSPRLVASAPYQIGLSAIGMWFDGHLDEIAVFNDVLAPDEIAAIRGGVFGSSSSSSFSSSSLSSSSSSFSFSSSSSSSRSSSSWSSSSSFVPLAWPTLGRGYEIEVREQALPADERTRLGCGRDKVMPRFSRRPHRWSFGIRRLALADRLTLERFYAVELHRGVSSWEFTHPKLGQTWLVKFDGRPRFEHEADLPGTYRFSAEIVEDTAGAYGAGAYGGQYYDS